LISQQKCDSIANL